MPHESYQQQAVDSIHFPSIQEKENNIIEKNTIINCVILFMRVELNNFIYTYFINPILSYNSYNLFNSVIYTILLFIIVWLLKLIFKISNIEINNKLLLSLIPFFILEILFRLINDTNVFNNSFYVFLFSTPLIYFVLIFLVFCSFFWGKISQKLVENNYSFILPIFLLTYYIFILFFENQIIKIDFSIISEIIILLFMIFIFQLLKNKYQINIFYLTIIFCGSYPVVKSLIIFYQLYENFSYSLLIDVKNVIYLFSFIIISAIIFFINRILKLRYEFINEPFMVLLIISMNFDIFASYLSYSLGNYSQHLITRLIFFNDYGIYLFISFKIIILICLMEFMKNILKKGINIFSLKENNNYLCLILIVIIIINFTTSIRVITKLVLSI